MSLLLGQAARDAWRWPHFKPEEFTSHGMDGAVLGVDPAFMDLLEELRKAFNAPLIVTSGYRTPAHNLVVAKTGEHGPHTTGRAADIRVEGRDGYRLLAQAMALGFTGIGIQQKAGVGTRFIHLDTLAAPEYPRPTVWSY